MSLLSTLAPVAGDLARVDALIRSRLESDVALVRQVAEYLESGFRQAIALTENNIMLRRHNDPALVALSEGWWDEVRSKSQRDQLSLSYVVEKSAYPGIALFDGGARSPGNVPTFGCGRTAPRGAGHFGRQERCDTAGCAAAAGCRRRSECSRRRSL